MKKIKLCLIAFFAIVFASMSCAFVATSVKHAEAAVSLNSGMFVMDDSGLTLRTNNQVGPRFKVKMEKELAKRIKTENITLSFLIAPRAAFDKVNYNYETLLAAAKAAEGNSSAPARIQVADKDKIYEEGDYSWASLVINTSETNRTLDMSVVAYITYSDGAGSLINRFAATDFEKVRGNLYNIVNATALSGAVLAKDILGNSEFGWYGAGNYPIEISTTEQAAVLKGSGADFSGKVVLADSSVEIPSEISGNVKTVTEQAVGGEKAEIVLGSEASYAVDMGISGGNVVKATIGGKVVSYADGKVTLDFDFENRLIKHGDQTLTVTVEKDGQYTNYNKKVLIVTKELQTYDDIKAAVTLNGRNVKYGYYRLTGSLGGTTWVNFGTTSVGEKPNNVDVWKNNDGEFGFRGTFDGGNNTLATVFYSTGLFGTIGKGAVIKNITLTQNEYVATRMLLGYSMVGATLENVTINVKGAGTTTLPDVTKWQVGGLLTAIYAHSNEFKNVTINSENTDVDTIFGSCSYYSYPPVGATNKFEECVITTKSLIGLACTNNADKTVTTAVGVGGLTVNVPRDDETATDKIIVGQAYGYSLADVAEITAVKLGNSDFTAYTFADGTLTINADAFSSSDTGSKTFVVTAKNEKGYVMNFNLNVTVVVANPVELDGMREIVLSSGNNFSVDLGEYTNATVLAATLGGENVTYSNGTLTVTDEFKANTQKHGNQTLSVIVQKDGTYYNVKPQVLVVTNEIKSAADWSVFASDKYTDNKLYGYYRLGSDIKGAAWLTGGVDSLSLLGIEGFKGTLDGNNHTIDVVPYNTGLLGDVGSGAVIKNINIISRKYDTDYNKIIGRRMWGATLDNVTITVPSNCTGTDPKTAYGLITGLYCYSTTFNNVTIDVGTKFASLIGASCDSIYVYPNTFNGCTLSYKDDESLGIYANWMSNGTLTSNYPLSGVSGITVSKKG